jgi:hypothetical protein
MVSTPMWEMPEHLSMPVNSLGQGPETDESMIAGTICWCMEPLCTRYRTGVGESMNRIPPAARQLITEIAEVDPNVHTEAVGDPDGYGVHRSIQFTRGGWVADALEACEDERIAEIHKENEASTRVTFVGDVRADVADEFYVGTAYEVLAGDEGDTEEQQQDGAEDDDEGEGDSPADESE